MNLRIRWLLALAWGCLGHPVAAQSRGFYFANDAEDEADEAFLLALEAGSGDGPVQVRPDTLAHLLDSSVIPALVDPEFDVALPPLLRSYYGGEEPLAVGLPDGKLVYVADRLSYDGQAGSVILRVLANGRLDPLWSPPTTHDPVTALALASDGTLLVAQIPWGEDNLGDRQLYRLQTDGSRDSRFHPSTEASLIHSLQVYPDGRVLVLYPELPAFVRYLTGGEKDPTFTSRVLEVAPTSFRVDGRGRVLVVARNGLLRLNADGTPDPSFLVVSGPNDPPIEQIESVLPLTDGRLLLHGRLASNQAMLVRLNPDGGVDPDFAALPTGDRVQLLRASDGASWFFGSSSDTPLFLERLLPDGSQDPAWSKQRILVLRNQADLDGSLGPRLVPVAGGDFVVLNSDSVNGHPRHRAAKVSALPGLKVVVDPSTARTRENAGDAGVLLLRSGPISEPLTLGWSTEPITAVPGLDYTPMRGTVTFPAGHRDATVRVPLLDNDQLDQDRFVRLRFTVPSGDLVPPPAGFAIANEDLGFPPDGLRVLADGRVLVRPTGWLNSDTYLEVGSLDAWRLGLETLRIGYREIFPELLLPGDGTSSQFFRLVDPTRKP
jgi:uncharacterized delta-60 repeat protein